MCIRVEHSQLNSMKAVQPLVESPHGKNKVKMSLLESVVQGLGADKFYYSFKEGARKALEVMAFMSTERGFVYIKQDTVAEKAGCTARTVRNILKESIEAGVLAVAYRRNKNTNAKGTPVYFFTEHPYFKKWAEMLGLEVAEAKTVEPPVMPDFQDECLNHFQEEKEDEPTESKAEEGNSVSYHKEPKNTNKLRDLNNISKSVLSFAQEKGKEMIKKAPKILGYWKDKAQLCAEVLPKKMEDVHYKALEIVIKEMMPDVTAKHDVRGYFAKCYDNALGRAKSKAKLLSMGGDWLNTPVSSQEAVREPVTDSKHKTVMQMLKAYIEENKAPAEPSIHNEKSVPTYEQRTYTAPKEELQASREWLDTNGVW